jgi:DNA helicase-2/ATP-dependent DNA helicase PcrA
VKHDDLNVVLGPPGTGKTTRLLDLMDEFLANGVDPRRMGFVGFTKKAAEEAKTRARERFRLSDDDLPYFRTIHSLAFKQLGLRRDEVIQRRHYKELGSALGLDLEFTVFEDEDAIYGSSRGSRMLFMENLARLQRRTLREVWGDDPDADLSWPELERLSRSLEEFKRARFLMDFTDMLENFIEAGPFPTFDVLFVDEAQDLSRIQWDVINQLAERSTTVFAAGDDDQAIYGWAGADVDSFLDLRGKTTTLAKSYRVPRSVQRIANSIVSQIGRRFAKQWEPKDVDGSVQYEVDPEQIDMSQGSWLLLARNSYLLKSLEQTCLREGFSFTSTGKNPLASPSIKAIMVWEQLRKGLKVKIEDAIRPLELMTSFSPQERRRLKYRDPNDLIDMAGLKQFGLRTEAIWHESLDKIAAVEREYFIAARKRGETLTGKPRINISTIHRSKGGQADNVVLLTDISYRTYEEMQRNFDAEARVFYVGATRTKENLYIVQPRTPRYFEI